MMLYLQICLGLAVYSGCGFLCIYIVEKHTDWFYFGMDTFDRAMCFWFWWVLMFKGFFSIPAAFYEWMDREKEDMYESLMEQHQDLSEEFMQSLKEVEQEVKEAREKHRPEPPANADYEIIEESNG